MNMKKIMQGLYENYLESKAKDPRMEGVNIFSKKINNLFPILAKSLVKLQMTAHGNFDVFG